MILIERIPGQALPILTIKLDFYRIFSLMYVILNFDLAYLNQGAFQ
jgi:hypothetical protein